MCSALEVRKFQTLGFCTDCTNNIGQSGSAARVSVSPVTVGIDCGSDVGERRPDFIGKCHCRRTLTIIKSWSSQGRPYCVYGFLLRNAAWFHRHDSSYQETVTDKVERSEVQSLWRWILFGPRVRLRV
jgi:hypothetical protein